MSRCRLILDTDLAMGAPGSDIDDGFALALSLADPDLELELVTTVNGNTDVESATILTRELLRRLGVTDVPVVKGAAAPLLHPEIVRPVAPEVARLADGLPSADEGYAAVEIARRVMAEPGQLTIVAIGPATNVAAAIALEPRLAANVAEIVLMGGTFLRSMPRRALPGEFNVWSDPEAAQAVLRSGAPQRWVGLDVTLQVRLTREHAERMSGAGTSFAEFAGRATSAWIDHAAATNPGNARDAESCAMHDPLAVAVLSRPELVGFRPAHVSVVTGDHPTARGVMVTDLLESADAPEPNCQIAETVDADAFTEYFLSLITEL